MIALVFMLAILGGCFLAKRLESRPSCSRSSCQCIRPYHRMSFSTYIGYDLGLYVTIPQLSSVLWSSPTIHREKRSGL